MTKIISIVGARPQFIKAAVVSKALRDAGFHELIVHTGQHYDFNMSDVFFEELNLPQPDYHLGVGSGTHGQQTGKMLIEIEKVLLKENPKMVIVYGDTNTTLAGALAAAKLHIPIAHVEAGLRSFNRRMPEEINRVLTDHISDLLFAPTETAVQNLKNEGIKNGVYLVGDVMFDLALHVAKIVDETSVLQKYSLKEKKYILTTIHRAENTDDPVKLGSIISSLNELSGNGVEVIFPAHPRTQKAISRFKINVSDRVKLIPAVSYKDMIALLKNAAVVITDSGGVQKESYFFKVPCVIPRNETEWVELVNSGWHVLTGQNTRQIFETTLELLNGSRKELEWFPFYGNGNASEKITEAILTYVSQREPVETSQQESLP